MLQNPISGMVVGHYIFFLPGEDNRRWQEKLIIQ